MKEQIEQLKKVYKINLRHNRWDKYSLYIVCREQTTFSNRYMVEQFETPFTTSTQERAFEAYYRNEEFKVFHQKYVNKLVEIGFRFV